MRLLRHQGAIGSVCRRLWNLRLGTEKAAPTKFGWLYILFTLGVGLAAASSSNNLLYLVTATLISSLIFSGVLSRVTLSGLSASAAPPPFIFAEEAFTLPVRLKNGKRFFSSYALTIADRENILRPSFSLRLPPRHTQELSCRAVARRRGEVRLRLEVRTAFPFGILEKRVVVGQASFVVFPKRVPIPQPPRRRAARGHAPPLNLPGDGQEFYQLRPYRKGDDARRINWKALARSGKLVTAEGSHEAEEICRLILHVTEVATPERIEQALSLIGSIALENFRAGVATAVTLPDAYIPPVREGAQLLGLLRQLALSSPKPTAGDGSPVAFGADVVKVVQDGVYLRSHVIR